MKKILLFGAFVLILLLSCSEIEPIHSLDQLEPALRKHVGDPSRIDTMLKDNHLRYNVISYDFDSVPDITFEQLVWFLFRAYNVKPIMTGEDWYRWAYFVPIQDGSGAYMIQLKEWLQRDNGEIHLGFSILDIKDELVDPSQSIFK